MTDYGRAVEFGYFPEPKADDIHRVIEEVVLAEQLGLDLVGIQDHPYQSRYVDSWVLLSTQFCQWTGPRTLHVLQPNSVSQMGLSSP